jgi:ribonuclease R
MDKIKQIKIEFNNGRLSVNASGSAYLVSTELPKDIYIHKTNTFHLDNVKIEIIEGNGRSIEGKVIEIIERFRTEFVGIIEISSNFAYFKPDSNKIPTDFYVPLSELMEAKDGQKVMVKLVNWFDGAKTLMVL